MSKDLTAEEAAKESSIRAKYKQSGVYMNNGSGAPLWTVNWYAYQVFVPSDGVHLIRRGPWASDRSDEALTFFENGRELQSYKVRDLVDFTWFLPHTASHFEWAKTIELDSAGQTLELITQYGDRYSFDLTGKIVYSWRRSRVFAGGGLLVVAGLVTLSAIFLKRRGSRLPAHSDR